MFAALKLKQNALTLVLTLAIFNGKGSCFESASKFSVGFHFKIRLFLTFILENCF